MCCSSAPPWAPAATRGATGLRSRTPSSLAPSTSGERAPPKVRSSTQERQWCTDLARQRLWSGGQTRGWWSTAGVSSHPLWPLRWLTQSSAPRTSSPYSILFAPMPEDSGLSSPPTSLAKTPDQPGLEEDLWMDRSGQARTHPLAGAHMHRDIYHADTKFLVYKQGHTCLYSQTWRPMGTYGHMQIQDPCVWQHHALTHIQKGTPHIPRGRVMFQHTYHKLDTNSGLSRTSQPLIRALELRMGLGIIPCLGLTPQSSSSLWGEREEELPCRGSLPLHLPCPHHKPYPHSAPLLCKCPCGLSPSPQQLSQLGNQRNGEC